MYTFAGIASGVPMYGGGSTNQTVMYTPQASYQPIERAKGYETMTEDYNIMPVRQYLDQMLQEYLPQTVRQSSPIIEEENHDLLEGSNQEDDSYQLTIPIEGLLPVYGILTYRPENNQNNNEELPKKSELLKAIEDELSNLETENIDEEAHILCA